MLRLAILSISAWYTIFLTDLLPIFLQDGFSKSVINKSKPRANEHLSEEEREKRMKEFVGKYEGEIKAFGWLKKFDDR